ncbi:DUF6146 family protein [Spongiimicrobium sp. 2-473A-2-J]|uniref:DUF6146 family protein n=1 Tax=Eudoraea algarum TaxID=3417568 RepID=UPI003D35EE3B
MKKIVLPVSLVLFAVLLSVASCTSTKETVEISDREKSYFDQKEGDTITIASEETEYEIIIIEPGFNIWLQGIARPPGYYSQSFLETRNQLLVTNWNIRVQNPQLYDPNLYILTIDYNPRIDYGYEVNYKLYNYFVFFQRKYGQRLGPFFPRI